MTSSNDYSLLLFQLSYGWGRSSSQEGFEPPIYRLTADRLNHWATGTPNNILVAYL